MLKNKVLLLVMVISNIFASSSTHNVTNNINWFKANPSYGLGLFIFLVLLSFYKIIQTRGKDQYNDVATHYGEGSFLSSIWYKITGYFWKILLIASLFLIFYFKDLM